MLLGSLGLRAYPASVNPLMTGLLLYGGLIELAQATTGWRTGDWLDWMADAIGVTAVYLDWIFWKSSRSRDQIHTS